MTKGGSATITAGSLGVLDGLSADQLSAVQHGDGPLLIIAGAGTGKTTVLTRRIAHLISTRAAKPEEILALTFTEKAALEMKERVDALIPYGYAETEVATFHAFGDRLLREHAFAASLSPDFRVLTRAEEVVFLRERLFHLPLARFRPLGDPGRFIPALLDFTSRAKDEDIGPDEIESWAHRELARLGNGPVGADAHREVGRAGREQALDLLEAARFYRAQQEVLAAAGALDFGDQLALALDLLRRRPDVRENLRTRYRYVLVDEFQDTNHAQLELVRLIVRENSPNLAVVGDDDQAIYRWRGAAPANLLAFLTLYPDATRVVLRRNHRSTQVILDAAHRLISYNNPYRLEAIADVDKRLQGTRHVGPDVEHRSFSSLSDEADHVAREIERCRDEDGLALSEIAILVRSNSDADPFLRALNIRGIPHRFSGGVGLYERPEVRVLLSFLRVLAAPDDSVSTYFLAASDVYAFPPLDLARLTRYANRKSRPLLEVLRDLAPAVPPAPREAAPRDAPPPNDSPENEARRELASLSGATREAAKRLVADIERGAASMAERRSGEVLYEFLKESGALAREVARGRAGEERRIRNIARFFETVRRVSSLVEPDRVPMFVARFDLLKDAGEDPPATEDDPGEAVNVLTVHKAKGLEFGAVFMVGCVDERFPLRKRGEALPLPAELLKADLAPGDPHLMEERRLFYVAMTRAKRRLMFTSSWDMGTRAPRKVSRFVVEALDLPSKRVAASNRSAEEALKSWEFIPPAAAPETSGRDAAEGLNPERPPGPPLRLSFRQIDDYLTCPLKYRFIHRQRIPLLAHHRVVYGSAIHRAVQAMFTSRHAGRPFGADDLVHAFRAAWVSEGFMSRTHEDLRLAEGERVLRAFHEAEARAPLHPTGVEEEFSFPTDSRRVVVAGRYDLVCRDASRGTTILDFKTGAVPTADRAHERARDSLQLRVYALAHFKTRGVLPVRVELRFLESGVAGGYAPTLDQANETETTIEGVGRRISAAEFEATPSHHACRPCPFRDICPATARGDD